MATMEGLQIFTLDRPIGACGPLLPFLTNAANGQLEPLFSTQCELCPVQKSAMLP